MLHIIANPASRSGRGKDRLQSLLKELEKEGLTAILHLTTHKGHAAELAASLTLTEQDQLLLVGGDGSLNEVINGLALPCPASVLVYPSGSGNDFARGMRLDRSQEAVIRLLKESSAVSHHQTDLGCVTSIGAAPSAPALKNHRFAVSCGFGMDAAICRALETGKLKAAANKLHVGKLSYLITGVKTLFCTGRKKRASVRITADENTLQFDNTVFISVHNLPFEGGGFPFAPDASPADGLLDVCIIHVSCRLQMLPLLAACLLGGRHGLFRRNVTILKCRTITAESDRPLMLHTDGEVVTDQLGFTASVLPSQIRVIR